MAINPVEVLGLFHLENLQWKCDLSKLASLLQCTLQTLKLCKSAMNQSHAAKCSFRRGQAHEASSMSSLAAACRLDTIFLSSTCSCSLLSKGCLDRHIPTLLACEAKKPSQQGTLVMLTTYPTLQVGMGGLQGRGRALLHCIAVMTHALKCCSKALQKDPEGR